MPHSSPVPPARRALPLPAPLAPLALLALLGALAAARPAAAQPAGGSPLHVQTAAFDFAADDGAARPGSRAVLVHNGGAVPLTDVRVTRIVFADSGRAGAWLVASPGRASVAPDELTAVGALCVRAAGLPAGTYRAQADVVAREVAAPVRVTVTLVVGRPGASGGSDAAAPPCARPDAPAAR